MCDDSCAQLVAAVGETRERMIELEVRLRRSDQVLSASSGIDVRSYEIGGARVEIYVEAELTNGNAFSWWLEFRCESGRWVIEASVDESRSDGQKASDDLGSWYAPGVRGLVDRLRSAVDMFAYHSVMLEVLGGPTPE